MFTDPEARKVYVHWEKEASDMLGRFRAAAARRPDDPDFTDLIERLHQASPEVRSWWPRHDVAPVGGGTKHLHHPALGDVPFQHTVLQVADHPEQMLVYFSTDEVPAAKLAALADGISSGRNSVRMRHLAARPAVSATHLPGEELAVTVHGRAELVGLREPACAELRQAMLDWYVPRQGPEFETWLDALDAVAARIEPEKIFTFSTGS